MAEATGSSREATNAKRENVDVPEPLILYIGAGWDVEALLYGSNFKCRRYVLVDCIPNRHLYWKPEECGYEISHSEELIVGIMRYKMALLEIPVERQERMVDNVTGKAMVRWTLRNGYEVCYYFDVKYPEDFYDNNEGSGTSSGESCPRGLRDALSEANILFMKGYPPLPFNDIVEICPSLNKLVSTNDNLKSVRRDASAEVLDQFEVMVVNELDLEAIQACTNSFEVVQKCIHMI